MTTRCLDLIRFVDGELEAELADAFRCHLVTCEVCRAGLLEAIQLTARLGALPPWPELVKPDLAAAAELPAGDPERPALPRRPRAARSRRFAPWVGAALSFAALATFVVGPRVLHPDHEVAPGANNAFAELKTRPLDTRFAHGDATSYRARNELRGARGPSREHISLDSLAALEKRDLHALAIATTWNGGNLSDSEDQLRALAQTPSVRSDLAALEIFTTSNDNVEALLTELEALGVSGAPAAARAARWNQAILLSRLDLPFSAARAFRAIAGDHEPGWADEARTRSETEQQRGRASREIWERADTAGQALVSTGTPVPAELVGQFPGLIRAHFYDAVRAAPSRDRVLALAPLAAELDRSGDQPILSDYVRRVARLDFHRRAPLARAYAQLLVNVPITAAAKTELTSSTASADVVDIAMGAMVQLHAVADHLEPFRRMVKQTGDPWFEIALAQAEAAADVQGSNWLDAEARLNKARKLCGPAQAAMTYRCLALAAQLGKLYQDLHRVPEALAVLHTALQTARSAGEWGHHLKLLWLLADVERFNSSTATARAYANEILLMAPDRCDTSHSAYMTLSGAALLEVDGRAARRYLDLALRCTEPDLSAANMLADIGRLDPTPGDLAQLQGWLSKLRASGTLTAAEAAYADEIEGRLLVESDRIAGIAVLERSIAAAEILPRDIVANKVRTGSYSVLVFDAARHGEHARVVALIAQELGLPWPGACVVGIVAEDERAVVVVRGPDGQDHAEYGNARHPGDGAPKVAAELARNLAGCAHVQVMAQAALQGVPRILPAALPWSYSTGARRAAAPSVSAPTAPQAVIVTNVTPPADLHLPPLAPAAPDLTPSTRTLSGPEATPSRVLAAMVDAREIQFHTHALVDMAVSDASYLVLSPGPDGSYALTAEAIRGTELRDQPIIVLAACHSAQGARYQHAPWSLPHAFLAAGARAVFAAGTAIPDLDARPFFARVLDRIRRGAAPAMALRDERMATLASTPSSWVADVMLFE